MNTNFFMKHKLNIARVASNKHIYLINKYETININLRKILKKNKTRFYI